MARLKRSIIRIAAGVEQKFDDLVFDLKRRLRLSEPLQIVTYRSYGTTNRLYIKGRLLEDKGIKQVTEDTSIFTNLLNMYKRFESDEVPGAVLKVAFKGEEHRVTTDKEGYFVLNLFTPVPITAENMWYEINIELVESPLPFEPGLNTMAEVLVPPADAEYGIISDIDDTIVKTTATNLLAMSRNTFFHNAHTRLPFAGVSEFYKALQLGRNGKRNNPFFYVSSSPWNLYDLLIDFMDLNEIPEGPLLLRDFGLNSERVISSDHMGHKLHEIENILDAFPHLNFVLIGDSGQEDPKIYREVIRKYPGRILAAYIRDVLIEKRKKIAINISKDLGTDTVEMILAHDTVQAAEHAAQIGLLYAEAIPEIVEDKKQDEGEIPGKQ